MRRTPQYTTGERQMRKTHRSVTILTMTVAVLFAVVLFAAAPASDAGNDMPVGAPGDYDVNDIAVINDMIANNGLGWTTASADGSNIPSDWYTVWSGGPAPERLVGLNLSFENMNGTLDVTGLDALEVLNCGSNALSYLDVTGCSALTKLSFSSNNGITVTGLSGLTSLKELECASNGFATLDLTGLDALEYLYCPSNNLTSLIITSPSLETLNCSNNLLTVLDMSSFRNIDYVNCSNNLFTVLDVAGYQYLEFLNCSNNRLTALDLTGCVAIERLNCSYNLMISTDDVIGVPSALWSQPTVFFLPQIISLQAIPNVIVPVASAIPSTTQIVTDQYTASITWSPAHSPFRYSTVYTATITITPISGVFSLTGVPANFFTVAGADTVSNSAGNGRVTAVFPATATQPPYNTGDMAIINSIIANNGLNWTPASPSQLASGSSVPANWPTYIWGERGTQLRIVELNFSSKDLYGHMILTGLTALEELNCYYNDGLTSLSAYNCTALRYMDCSFNNLGTLNVEGCTSLEYLDCSHNAIATLSLNGCTSLEYLDCFKNELRSLSLNGCTSLEYLDCSQNAIATLDTSVCISLEYLDCSQNAIAALYVVGCDMLEYLDCSENRLRTLDVTGLSALIFLDCSYNYLAGKSSVIGFEGEWDETNFIFGTQNTTPDEGGSNLLILVAVIAAIAVIIVVYFFFIRPKK